MNQCWVLLEFTIIYITISNNICMGSWTSFGIIAMYSVSTPRSFHCLRLFMLPMIFPRNYIIMSVDRPRYIIVWRVDRQRTVMTCYDSFFPVLFLETNIQYSLDVAWCIRRAIDLTRINYYHLKTLTFKYSMLNWLRLIQEY